MQVKSLPSRAAAFARYTRVPPRESGQPTSDFLFRGACCSYGVDGVPGIMVALYRETKAVLLMERD